MEYIVTYHDENGTLHVAHVTNVEKKDAAKMVEQTVGEKIKVVSVEVATICVPEVVMSFAVAS